MISDELKETVRKIDALDLTKVKTKLCLPPKRGGQGWLRKQAQEYEVWYKRFLKLKLVSGKKVLVPTKEIDDFWHAHILDTWHYHEDCQNIFGRFLHHNPYFGLGSEEEAREMHKAYLETMALFQHYFGERPFVPQEDSYSPAGCGGMECA